MTASETASAVREMVLRRFQASFHMPSCTHIYYSTGAGPEVKGFGDWPDQAYGDFKTRLDAEIAKASPEKLWAWKVALEGVPK